LYFPPGLTVWRNTPPGRLVWIGVDPAGDGEDATGIAAVCLLPADDVSPAGSLHVVDAMSWDGAAADAPHTVAQFARRLQTQGHQVAGCLVEANQGPYQFFVRELRQLIAPVTVQSKPPTLSKSERALPATLFHQHGQLSIDPSLRGSTLDSELHTFSVSGLTVSGHDDAFDAAVWAMGVATKGFSIRPTLLAA
jgi:phage terminase large subunit-like protein